VVVWIAAMMLIIAVALFVAAPLTDYVVGRHGTAPVPEEPRGQARERALAIQALRELEFDYATGKLDTHDYGALKHRLENRALAAMDTRQPQLSQPTAAPRRPTTGFCSQCGAGFPEGENSCLNCGANPPAAANGQIR
jgi:cytochrome c-type biogenesis protein CcmI